MGLDDYRSLVRRTPANGIRSWGVVTPDRDHGLSLSAGRIRRVTHQAQGLGGSCLLTIAVPSTHEIAVLTRDDQ